MPRFLKPGRLVVYVCILIRLFTRINWKMILEEDITIKKGQPAAIVLQELKGIKKQRLKRAFAKHKDELATLQPGTYEFTGSYTPQQVIDILLAGPKSIYQRVTILEGRNIRDIDGKLTEEGLISTGAYLSFVTDTEIITRYTDRYDFLQQAVDEGKTITTLEGFLYPETYLIDPTKDVIDQLVYLQLEAFNDRIRKVYGERLKEFSAVVQTKGYSFRLSSYAALILASIIEKEERTDENKPTIASVFFNRLESGMKIDADISLCYGLKEPYSSCTTSIIVEHLNDASNPYNTRAVFGLPPTPISTVHVSSLEAILTATKTDLFFYLHDSDGRLHTAKDISEHNSNKSKYLP